MLPVFTKWELNMHIDKINGGPLYHTAVWLNLFRLTVASLRCTEFRKRLKSGNVTLLLCHKNYASVSHIYIENEWSLVALPLAHVNLRLGIYNQNQCSLRGQKHLK